LDKAAGECVVLGTKAGVCIFVHAHKQLANPWIEDPHKGACEAVSLWSFVEVLFKTVEVDGTICVIARH
jgi:hypothetical protein